MELKLRSELEEISKREQQLQQESLAAIRNKAAIDEQLRIADRRKFEIHQQLQKIESNAEVDVKHQKDMCVLQAKMCQLQKSLAQTTKDSKKHMHEKRLAIAERNAANVALSQVRNDLSQAQRDMDEMKKTCDKTEEELSKVRTLLSTAEVEARCAHLEKEKSHEELKFTRRLVEITQIRQLQETSTVIQVTERIETNVKQAERPANYEHVAVIKKLYVELSEMLNPLPVAAQMFQHFALTVKELQSIQSKRETRIVAAEFLLDIIIEQPYEVYECFLDALKPTNQEHIYHWLLSRDFTDHHNKVITETVRQHYVFLLEQLDVKSSGLLDRLWSNKVLTLEDFEMISAGTTSTRRNEKLLSVLSQKSAEHFKLFFDALDKTGQTHITDALTGRNRESTMADKYCQEQSQSTSRHHSEHQPEQENTTTDQLQRIIKTEQQRLSELLEIVSKRERLLTNYLKLSQPFYQKALCYIECVPEITVNELECKVACGLTSIDNELFILCGDNKSPNNIEVYDKHTLSLTRRLSAPGLSGFQDMTACKHHRCLYVSESRNQSVVKVPLDSEVSRRFSVGDKPFGLSVTPQSTLLVTCCAAGKLKEFTADGRQLREIKLQEEIMNPQHAVQLPTGLIAVCHGDRHNRIHRVCIINADGYPMQTYGGLVGSAAIGALNGPRHLAVDEHGFVFVSDLHNCRVLLLSPTLSYVREITSTEVGDSTRTFPRRLYWDNDTCQLYVAHNKFDTNCTKFTEARITVVTMSVTSPTDTDDVLKLLADTSRL